jgi:hypothetical protein
MRPNANAMNRVGWGKIRNTAHPHQNGNAKGKKMEQKKVRMKEGKGQK